MCEHVVFASYVALESYLISKFGEYFNHVFSSVGNEQRTYLLQKRLSFRDLKEIERHYSKLLNISLATFEPDLGVLDEVEWFQPKKSWDGLKILQQIRNELAHHGEVSSYNIFVLVDAWSAFDFVRQWIDLFETNFNEFIYEGRQSELVRESMISTRREKQE